MAVSRTQSCTKYLRQTLYKIAHYGKTAMSIFKKFCASIDKIFILEGRLGTRQKSCEI